MIISGTDFANSVKSFKESNESKYVLLYTGMSYTIIEATCLDSRANQSRTHILFHFWLDNINLHLCKKESPFRELI